MKINIQDLQDQEKMKFLMEMEEARVDGLELQCLRIYASSSISNVHDEGFYFILLRRIYREIENRVSDSRVANFKGQHKEFFKKLKIRDHFEHNVKPQSQLEFARLSELGISCEPGASVNIRTSTGKNH